MRKRRFRHKRPSTTQTGYPTLEAFDAGRRRFIAGLGGLLGAGALAACGGRAAQIASDGGTPPDPPPPDPPNQGGALPPPAQADLGPDWTVDGDPLQPDARVDQAIVLGEAPTPDAKIDQKAPAPDTDPFAAGGAPMPPAQLDGGCDEGGSCPNP